MQEIYERVRQEPNKHLPFWSVVAHQMNWRGPVSTLQQRFVKVFTMKGLSIREKMLLKKLLSKKQSNSSITMDAILYHFPGRSEKDIRDYQAEGDLGKNSFVLEDDQTKTNTVSTNHNKVFTIMKEHQ